MEIEEQENLALARLQNAEVVSAASIAQHIQADLYEEAKNKIGECFGREFYSNVESDLFPEPQYGFIFPLIKSLRAEGYFLVGLFLPRWSTEGGQGGSLVLHLIPPSFASRDAERKYRIRWGTRNYNHWAPSRHAIYAFVRQDISRILAAQTADLYLQSVGEETAFISSERTGRAEFEAARRGDPYLKQLATWSVWITKPPADMSIFFAKGARRYESFLLDWAKFGSSRLCEAMSLAIPHSQREQLIAERRKADNPTGERFRTLPGQLDPLTKEELERKFNETHRSLPIIPDQLTLQDFQRQDRAEMRRRRKLQEARSPSESRSPRGRSSSDGDRTEVEAKRVRNSMRDQPITTGACSTTTSIRAPITSDAPATTTNMPITTIAGDSIYPSTASVFTTTITKTTSSTSHKQVVPSGNLTRVHFRDEANRHSQTITTDSERSKFPNPTPSSDTVTTALQPRPAPEMRSERELRGDLQVNQEEMDEDVQDSVETPEQIQEIPLLPVPQGAQLPPPQGLRERPPVPLSPTLCIQPPGEISTYFQPRYYVEQPPTQATITQPALLWRTAPVPVSRPSSLLPYVPPANPDYYNPAQTANSIYCPTPIRCPTTTAGQILDTLAQMQTLQTTIRNLDNGISSRPIMATSSEISAPEITSPQSTTPAAANQTIEEPETEVERYSPTSPGYQPSSNRTFYKPSSPEFEPNYEADSNSESPEIRPAFSPEPQSNEANSSSDDEETPEQTRAKLIKTMGPKQFKKFEKLYRHNQPDFNYYAIKNEKKERKKKDVPEAVYEGEPGRLNK